MPPASAQKGAVTRPDPRKYQSRSSITYTGKVSCEQDIRLILQHNGNVSWRRRAQIKQLAWPIAERQIGHQKSCSVLFARFPVVNWRSCPVAKSACLPPQSFAQQSNTTAHFWPSKWQQWLSIRFCSVSRTRQSFPLPVDFETKTAAGFAQSIERWPAEREFAGLITGTELIRRVLK